MPLEVLLAWWNLIYVVPFGLALCYLGLFVFTGITFGEADADVDADADADVGAHVEADMDADADADVDADGDVDGDQDALATTGAEGGLLADHEMHDHSVDAHGHGSLFGSFLSFLGLGKIPLSLALMILFFSWGFTGFAINTLLVNWLGASDWIAVISLPVTMGISVALTGLFAALIAKVIPTDEGPRERREDLVGKPGEAIFDIDANFGMAKVRGQAGDFFQIPCHTGVDKPRIVKGTRVVIFNYDREKGVFEVAPFDA